jgi:hypothetical protein
MPNNFTSIILRAKGYIRAPLALPCFTPFKRKSMRKHGHALLREPPHVPLVPYRSDGRQDIHEHGQPPPAEPAGDPPDDEEKNAQSVASISIRKEEARTCIAIPNTRPSSGITNHNPDAASSDRPIPAAARCRIAARVLSARLIAAHGELLGQLTGADHDN